ncbi:adenylyltransferase/cytidyltransferase family protein [Oceanobacillus sp. Castelsardo]|uniref:adenylyltransferase/cytidyltransferase family protein n=1 Tax=Oceanobacillus sp. Castelsardo TaxID=1851204 RepID=UPI000839B09D|nr:adenylyltransferase/cytidyltransferase family protein [Oceanobacillus sp. Castelsardo]
MKTHCSQTLNLNGSVITIGAFDGVHKGHQKVIERLVEQAEIFGVPSVVYTFDPPPRAYFQQVQILSTYEDKMIKLSKLGIDHVVIATFNSEYINRTADSFIDELALLKPFNIIVGEDFRFGHKRTGDIKLLREHFQVETLNPVCCSKGQRISSTRIRELISNGKLEQAIPLLK